MPIGLPHAIPSDDRELVEKRRSLVRLSAKRLADANMIVFNESTSELSVTDLGRIAADYYISVKSIELFNQKFRPAMSEADMFALLSQSTEVRMLEGSCTLFDTAHGACSLNRYRLVKMKCLNSTVTRTMKILYRVRSRYASCRR